MPLHFSKQFTRLLEERGARRKDPNKLLPFNANATSTIAPGGDLQDTNATGFQTPVGRRQRKIRARSSPAIMGRSVSRIPQAIGADDDVKLAAGGFNIARPIILIAAVLGAALLIGPTLLKGFRKGFRLGK